MNDRFAHTKDTIPYQMKHVDQRLLNVPEISIHNKLKVPYIVVRKVIRTGALADDVNEPKNCRTANRPRTNNEISMVFQSNG